MGSPSTRPGHSPTTRRAWGRLSRPRRPPRPPQPRARPSLPRSRAQLECRRRRSPSLLSPSGLRGWLLHPPLHSRRPKTTAARSLQRGRRQLQVTGRGAASTYHEDASRRRGWRPVSQQLRAAPGDSPRPRRPSPPRGQECVTVGNVLSGGYFRNTSNDYFSCPHLLWTQDVREAVSSAGLVLGTYGNFKPKRKERSFAFKV